MMESQEIYSGGERWRPAYKGQYLISDKGRAYTQDRLIRCKAPYGGKVFYRKARGKMLELNINNTGYKRLSLISGPVLFHRVVASLFIENPDNLATVNHIDGDKLNNRVDNLEWLSTADNTSHAWATGLFPDARLKVVCVDTGEVFNSLHDAASHYGLWVGNLCTTLKGKQKTFAGRTWRYLS